MLSLKASLEEQIGRLVHPIAHASPETAARHRLFMKTRLAFGFGALALVPISMASGSVPEAVDAVVLGWLLLPLVAVAHLSARGHLASAARISGCAWVGLAMTLVLGGLAGPGTAAVILLLLPLEASLEGAAPRVTAASALAALMGTTLLAAAAWFVPVTPHGAEPLFLVLAASYAALLCVCIVGVRKAELDEERRQRRQADVLSAVAPDLVMRFDGAGATPLNGKAAQRQFGLDGETLAKRGFFDRVHVADRPEFLKLISDAAHGNGEHSGRVRLRTSSQTSGAGFEEPIFAVVEIRARRWPEGSDPHAALATIRKVAGLEPAPPAPVELDAGADTAWRDRFLATVSHELRTPLNAIIGFSELLATDAHAPKLADKRREYADIILASGQHLLEIVNSMLDLSKIDAGKFDLAVEPFAIQALLASCGDMMRLKAEKARIDLQWSVTPAELRLTADKRACRQIVLNLLSNALKFTPEYGRVTLEASLEGNMLVLAVADTGIGILAPDMARLGDPFFQAQNSYDRRFEGTGLGLSVVSGLVGLHGGTITAESAPGEGTRITIRLPCGGCGSTSQPGRAKIETITRQQRGVPGPEFQPAKVKKIA